MTTIKQEDIGNFAENHEYLAYNEQNYPEYIQKCDIPGPQNQEEKPNVNEHLSPDCVMDEIRVILPPLSNSREDHIAQNEAVKDNDVEASVCVTTSSFKDRMKILMESGLPYKICHDLKKLEKLYKKAGRKYYKIKKREDKNQYNKIKKAFQRRMKKILRNLDTN